MVKHTQTIRRQITKYNNVISKSRCSKNFKSYPEKHLRHGSVLEDYITL